MRRIDLGRVGRRVEVHDIDALRRARDMLSQLGPGASRAKDELDRLLDQLR